MKFKDGSMKVDMTTANMMLQVLDKINPMALYYAAAANFGWGDPKGSVGEKLIDDLWKQFVDFQRIEKLGLPKVQPQNAPFTR